MEGNEEKVAPRNGFINGIKTSISNSLPELANNITALDLSDRNIVKLEDAVNLPPKLTILNMSRNKLTDVPSAVLILDNLKSLDLSHNNIMFFDETPNFAQTIEELNLSQNRLQGPPYWAWSESPKNLVKLNLSFNKALCESFVNGYAKELLNYTTNIQDIDICNCGLSTHLTIMWTFRNAKIINLGCKFVDYNNRNCLVTLPCEGLDKCCDVERLNVTDTHIYTINSNIDIYKCLVEINLSDNCIHSLPNEFCNLLNLEICILSYNRLLYLPDDMCKLKKLITLLLDENELCMLPTCLNDLPNIKRLDIYNNYLYEGVDGAIISNLDEIDMAQNYFEEPNCIEYKIRKEKLRLILGDPERKDGSKAEKVDVVSEHSPDTSDDEIHALNSAEKESPDRRKSICSESSSSEDWDTDEYWIPHSYCPPVVGQSAWLSFIKRKMDEGNFCPIDAHTLSIAEQVKYEKLCQPQEQYESDGQFDDYSGDDS